MSTEHLNSDDEKVAEQDSERQPTGLLPCPWCEMPPEVCKAAGYGFTVECVNETCAVGPALNVTRGRQNAIKAWNTRASTQDTKSALRGDNPERGLDSPASDPKSSSS